MYNKIFLLLFFIGCSVALQDAIKPFLGSYSALYIWPKIVGSHVKYNCVNVTFTTTEDFEKATCTCDKGKTNYGFFNQEFTYELSQQLDYMEFALVVNTDDEAKKLFGDKCRCKSTILSDPNNLQEMVPDVNIFRKLNEDYFVRYFPGKNGQYSKTLLGKKAPNAEELKTLIDSFDDLKNEEGTLLCNSE